MWAKIGESWVWNSKNQKLLRLIIDRNLNFDDYPFILRKKLGRKLTALARISSYIGFEKKRILLKAFVESQFGY